MIRMRAKIHCKRKRKREKKKVRERERGRRIVIPNVKPSHKYFEIELRKALRWLSGSFFAGILDFRGYERRRGEEMRGKDLQSCK